MKCDYTDLREKCARPIRSNDDLKAALRLYTELSDFPQNTTEYMCKCLLALQLVRSGISMN